MRFGVKINKKGEIDITDPNLIRYRDILNSLLSYTVFCYMMGVKYSSRRWNMFEDEHFLSLLERELDKCIEFLVEQKIFPVDILTPRPSVCKELDVFRLKGTRVYGVWLETNAFGYSMIPTYDSLLAAVNKSKIIRLWTLIKEPRRIFVYFGVSRGKKLSQRGVELLWSKAIDKDCDFYHNYVNLFSKNDKFIETGLKVVLDTKELNQYSSLKYILETS